MQTAKSAALQYCAVHHCLYMSNCLTTKALGQPTIQFKQPKPWSPWRPWRPCLRTGTADDPNSSHILQLKIQTRFIPRTELNSECHPVMLSLQHWPMRDPIVRQFLKPSPASWGTLGSPAGFGGSASFASPVALTSRRDSLPWQKEWGRSGAGENQLQLHDVLHPVGQTRSAACEPTMSQIPTTNECHAGSSMKLGMPRPVTHWCHQCVRCCIGSGSSRSCLREECYPDDLHTLEARIKKQLNQQTNERRHVVHFMCFFNPVWGNEEWKCKSEKTSMKKS